MNGAEAITAQLAAQGIGTIFSVAGASHSYFLDALDRHGMMIVSNRHESGAVGCADGYARTLAESRPERPGIALIVSEQGLANAVGGLAVANAAGSPVVVLVAAPPRGRAESAAILDHDQLALVAPVSKWARTVPAADRLADYMATAIRTSLTGRPGPTVLIIPQDFFRANVDSFVTSTCSTPVALAAEEQLDEAAALLRSASRPLIIAGFGCLSRSGRRSFA